MGKKESIQKKIDKLDRKLKFYQSMIFAIMSAIVWSVYAILEKKSDNKIIILSVIGVLVLIYLVIFIKYLEMKQDKLIDELERIE